MFHLWTFWNCEYSEPLSLSFQFNGEVQQKVRNSYNTINITRRHQTTNNITNSLNCCFTGDGCPVTLFSDSSSVRV